MATNIAMEFVYQMIVQDTGNMTEISYQKDEYWNLTTQQIYKIKSRRVRQSFSEKHMIDRTRFSGETDYNNAPGSDTMTTLQRDMT